MAEKNAVVLSGGSVKGAFQAGALPVVFARGFVPDALYGVSVGALNAAFLADRVGRQVRAGRPPDWVAAARELETFWKTKVKEPSDLAKKKTFAVLDVILHHFDSLLDPKPLEALIAAELDVANVTACPAKLFVTATQLEDGLSYTVPGARSDLARWVLASSMIPVVLPPQEIGGNHYVDGGARMVAPLKPAIDDGADRVVVVACQAVDPAPYTFDGNLGRYAERLSDIAVNALVNNDLRRVRRNNQPGSGHRKVEVIELRPQVQPQFDLQEFTSADIVALIAAGKRQAELGMPVLP